MHTALIPNVPDPVERAPQSAATVASFPDQHGIRADMSHEQSASQTSPPATLRLSRRRRGTKGSELIEFTLNFLPFMIMIIVTVDTAWAIWAQSTLQQAVRMAARQGVTLTTSQVSTNLTDTVKGIVQQHSVGLLNGSTGLAYIKVNYFDQDNPLLDVSNQASGNRGGNVMRVSVQGYPLSPLMARFWGWSGSPDASPMSMTVYAADVIEPIATFRTAAIGPAP